MAESNGRRPNRHAEAERTRAQLSEEERKERHGGGKRNGPNPVVDWNAAFAYYASLLPNERSYAAVSKQFGVSEVSVRKWAHRDDWQNRVAAIESQAMKRVERRAIRALQERMETVIRLGEATFVRYAEQLQQGEVKVTPQDVVTFAKLMQLIEGRPDARVETMLAEVTRMSDQELHEELERMRQLDEHPIEEV